MLTAFVAEACLLTPHSRLLQVVLPLLQGHQGAVVQVRRQVLRS